MDILLLFTLRGRSTAINLGVLVSFAIKISHTVATNLSVSPQHGIVTPPACLIKVAKMDLPLFPEGSIIHFILLSSYTSIESNTSC